jgi:hypothetical protein
MMESKKEPMVTCQNYYSYSTAIDKPKKAEKNWGKTREERINWNNRGGSELRAFQDKRQSIPSSFSTRRSSLT